MDRLINSILTANASVLVNMSQNPTVLEVRLARALKLLLRDLDNQDPRREAIERIVSGE